jgi:hypothetical protein
MCSGRRLRGKWPSVEQHVDRVVLSHQQAEVRPKSGPEAVDRIGHLGDGEPHRRRGAEDASVHQREQELFLLGKR